MVEILDFFSTVGHTYGKLSIKYIMMSKVGFSEIVKFMTPEVGVVLICGYFSNIVKMQFLF